MANDNNSQGPVLDPDTARSLEQAGYLTPETASQIYGSTLNEAPAIAPGISQDIVAENQVANKLKELQESNPVLPVRPGVGMGFDNIVPVKGVTEQDAVRALVQEQQDQPTQEELFAQAQEADRALIKDFEAKNAERAMIPGLAPLVPSQEVQDAINAENVRAEQAAAEVAQRPASDFTAPTDFAPTDAAQADGRGLAAIEQQGQDVYAAAIAANKKLADNYIAERERVMQAAKQQEAEAEIEAEQERNRVVNLIAEQEQKAEEAAQEYRDATVERPEGYFGQTGFWNQFFAGLAVGLSRVGQGAGNGPNAAIQILEKAVDQDIKEQEFKRKQLGEVAENQRGLYLKMLDKLKDPVAAKSAAKAQIWKQAQQQLGMLGDKFGIQQNSENFKLQMMQLQQKEQAARGDLQQRLRYEDMLKNAHKYSPADFRIAGGEQGRKDAMLLVPGYGIATGPEVAKTASEALVIKRNVDKTVDDLISQYSQLANRFSFSSKAEAKSMQKTLAGQLRLAIVGPGAMTDKEFKLLQSLIPNPTDLFSIPARDIASLKQLKDNMNNIFNNKLRAAGIEPRASKVKTFQPEQ